MKIKIGKPYIEYTSSNMNEKAVRLCSNIVMENPITGQKEEKVLFFEFEERYASYLCQERSDACVAGLLIAAMENNCDIEYEAPISERLYYQLSTYFIPMVSQYNSRRLGKINLIGKFTNEPIKNAGKVATGCSGGVDSYYTIVKHSKEYMIENYRLTHLVFASCGTLDNDRERIEKYYIRHFSEVKHIADEIGCDIIGCYTNLHEFYKFPYEGFCTFYATIYASVAFALQKLIKIYYESSGDPISEFTLDLDKAHGHDASVFDVFTLGCLCTENISFYNAGVECSRIEKEEFISSSKSAQHNLTVCGRENSGAAKGKYPNCGTCPKCLRTIVQLYVLRKLDYFGNVFDLEDFYRNKYKRIGKMLATNKRSYVGDTLKIAKKNHVKLGIRSYLWKYLCFNPYKIFSHVMNDNLFVRKIYYKLNLDYKIHGYRDAKYEVYKDKI